MSRQFGQKVEPEAVRAAKEHEIHNDFLRLLFKLLNGTVRTHTLESKPCTLNPDP
jgi:paired amphipathic helix protein Sin3a